MSTTKPTDAEIRVMAEQWFRQHDRPLEPFAKPLRLVPYNELSGAGAGSILAAAIRGDLAERGYVDGEFRFTGFWIGKNCMNCGERKPARQVEDGWCDDCSGHAAPGIR